MPKRALIIQGGTMRGAYFVGVLKVFERELGKEYFDTIFSTSVGIFEQVPFVTNQMEELEEVWVEYSSGRKLINFLNPLRKKPILDLDYLINILKTRLNIRAMENSKANLYTFITDWETKEPILMDLKQNNIFDLMRAACALPLLYPKKVFIGGRRYVDGRMTPVRKFRNILQEELKAYDEVIGVISNKYFNQIYGLREILEPSRMPLLNSLDTNKERIKKTIKQGEIDAENFLEKRAII
ncbi:hypothetical protein A3I95_01800 [Candidatus Nomurabacteria bacterium RIFCSPLOWO2_02_FULL_44_12]|uniref:PNPLA domain-containing protein n=1 Tax=Candidatus Nomurabacteria bacterium RIFCSPLOWO2_12_FULL_44_11 TaxID=1801796 RepID=A0A1F6Y6I4_9BACT|nr:MAG: hypothetical protein A3E95_01370 [Candidatus Nomurabacteria bacterium RIFCSPHIGHO2_12_FULL_44_22b]OGJ01952.1 MAG: hypothetical protein A3G53_01545 [Candidatus Nomurabacteria bacterium RIFCSPLOWO2_12_FULL_44_11]OGJ08609.1 MAG: hypothetical protein A3I95_01800 [Candidatus Nomurabacteria bacterium RIFCSPLOWO2_02_FULL_44_12]